MAVPPGCHELAEGRAAGSSTHCRGFGICRSLWTKHGVRTAAVQAQHTTSGPSGMALVMALARWLWPYMVILAGPLIGASIHRKVGGHGILGGIIGGVISYCAFLIALYVRFWLFPSPIRITLGCH